MVLTRKFFERSALVVAKDVLGKYLVRKIGGKTVARMITETEAYGGYNDKASHSSRGITPRNKIMFGPPAYFYVYLTYGIHWLLNIVTGRTGYPSAVLIRGVEGVNGPARITKLFKINGSLNKKVVNKKSGLWIEDRGVKIKSSQIKRTPRIGVDYAGPVWSKKKYRFLISS